MEAPMTQRKSIGCKHEGAEAVEASENGLLMLAGEWCPRCGAFKSPTRYVWNPRTQAANPVESRWRWPTLLKEKT